MTAKASLSWTGAAGVVVPLAAVTDPRDGEAGLFVIADGKAHLKDVTLGPRNDTEVQVLFRSDRRGAGRDLQRERAPGRHGGDSNDGSSAPCREGRVLPIAAAILVLGRRLGPSTARTPRPRPARRATSAMTLTVDQAVARAKGESAADPPGAGRGGSGAGAGRGGAERVLPHGERDRLVQPPLGRELRHLLGAAPLLCVAGPRRSTRRFSMPRSPWFPSTTGTSTSASTR